MISELLQSFLGDLHFAAAAADGDPQRVAALSKLLGELQQLLLLTFYTEAEPQFLV